MYRTDITQSIEPAMANPNTLAKVSEAQAAQVRSETAMQETFSKVGADIFSGVYKAYTGQQQEKKVKALGEDISTGVDDLRSQMDEIIAMDTSNKTKAELERAQMVGNEAEISAGAILAGADPVIANQVANVFTTENENKFISNFREEQQRIMLARDAMPQRQHEMMLRSEALLKKAIAETPELANNFRQIAEQVTGKSRVDLYSVNKLYEDINFIERQKQEAGKAAQKQEDLFRTAYVHDRTTGDNPISQTQALLEWQQLSPKEKAELANASVAITNSSKQADAALKAGGDALTNLTTLTKISFENELLGENTKIISQLKLLGLSSSALASGNIPPEIANSDAYKKLIDEGGTRILNLLGAQYKAMNDKLIEKIKTVPADANAVRQAQQDLKAWYDKEKAYYTENKSSWLLATTAEPKDPLETMQKRFTFINTFVQTLGIPPDVASALILNGDTKAYNDAIARYPSSARELAHIQALRKAALQQVSTQEFMQLAKDFDAYKADGSKSNKVPTNISEATAVCMSYEACADTTRKAVTDKNVVVEDPIGLVNQQVKFGLLTPAATERLLKSGLPTITAFINTRVPEADRPNVVNLINMSIENKVYGALSNGDIAKEFFKEASAKYAEFKDIGVSLVFKDTTGASALQVIPTNPAKDLPQNKQYLLQKYNLPSGGTRSTPPSAMAGLEKQLKVVDDVLKIQSQLTGVSIFELRKNFIKTFTSQGSVSEAYSAQTQAMVSGETPLAVAPSSTTDFSGAAPIPASALANQEAMKLEEEKRLAVEPAPVVPASELGSQQFTTTPAPALPVSAAPAVAPPVVIPPAPVTSNVPTTSPREATGKLIDESKRPDGTFKGTGYLGVLKASDGTDVTEYSISTSDLKVKGKEIDFPLIVPTLTKAEVNLMLTDIIPNKKRIPDAIYKKAIDHAKKRIKQGKSVFAETGDYKPEAVIAPKKSSLSGQRPDLQPDAGSATSNAAPRTSTTEKWWRK